MPVLIRFVENQDKDCFAKQGFSKCSNIGSFTILLQIFLYVIGYYIHWYQSTWMKKWVYIPFLMVAFQKVGKGSSLEPRSLHLRLYLSIFITVDNIDNGATLMWIVILQISKWYRYLYAFCWSRIVGAFMVTPLAT